MKHVTYFDHFLRNTVNLNQTRLNNLGTSVDALYKALKADEEVGPYVRDKKRQGSWAYRTIIKPVGTREFDADILLVMEHNPDWSPADYVNKVWGALHRHSVYKDMPHSRKCRCARLVYAAQYHVDIVPEVTLPEGRTVICNRDDDTWENSNPVGFAEWFEGKDDIANGNLRRVIRILKYLRDHKGTFSLPSVILTTLVGEQVLPSDTIMYPGCYDDVPETLLHLVEALDDYMQRNTTKPSVPVPGGSGETFDHRWEQATYDNFRSKFNDYARKVRDAYDETDKEASIAQWQALFGDGFTAPPSKSSSGRYGASAAARSSIVNSGRAG